MGVGVGVALGVGVGVAAGVGVGVAVCGEGEFGAAAWTVLPPPHPARMSKKTKIMGFIAAECNPE